MAAALGARLAEGPAQASAVKQEWLQALSEASSPQRTTSEVCPARLSILQGGKQCLHGCLMAFSFRLPMGQTAQPSDRLPVSTQAGYM